MRDSNLLQGVLVIDKPAGITSHDVVERVRQLLRQYQAEAGLPTLLAAKVGHAGTLDPFATGVLVVALGSATRLIQFTQHRAAASPQPLVTARATRDWLKIYDATIRLGATSTTDDSTGEIRLMPTANEKRITNSSINNVLSSFQGRINQVPPAYSALKVRGVRAYEKAQAGESFILPARIVYIASITLFETHLPEVRINVRCGTGTYIRALARDIGQKLGVGAYCTSLRRTAVGPLDIQQALPLKKLTSQNLPHVILPPETLVSYLPKVKLAASLIEPFRQGLAVMLEPDSKIPHAEVAVFSAARLHGVGLYQPASRRLQPTVVL